MFLLLLGFDIEMYVLVLCMKVICKPRLRLYCLLPVVGQPPICRRAILETTVERQRAARSDCTFMHRFGEAKS
jgi:hypothetical protein